MPKNVDNDEVEVPTAKKLKTGAEVDGDCNNKQLDGGAAAKNDLKDGGKDVENGNEKKETKSTSKNDEKEGKGEDVKPVGGTLLICGGTNWDLTGRKELPKSIKPISTNPLNLWGPHRWREKIRIKEVVSSCTACHSVIITEEGRVLTFGRNDKGQCGVGDSATRLDPVYVDALKNERIITAATGRGHTLFLNEKGNVFACGDNKMGQLGIGSQSSSVLTPTRISYSGVPIVKVACGAEFSMILDAVGALYSFGSPEYGQLGHNSEGKYFTTGNKISYNCEAAPRRILVFIEKSREGHIIPLEDVSIVDISCGINHTLACDSKKRGFTWGFAGYGRLGHNETKDELMPRNLKAFDYLNRGIRRVWSGGCFSMALDENGMLYFWGQTKSSGEATMYPKPVQDLSGWEIRSVGAGNRSIVVVADESVISWGPSPTYGELGYGENKGKSSTTPKELKLLEGIHVYKVATGFGHTLFLAADENEEDSRLLEKLPLWP